MRLMGTFEKRPPRERARFRFFQRNLTSIFRLLCVVTFTADAQPSGSGVIAGTVVDSSSGDPVRKAIVTVTWHGSPKSWATARTDGSGKFRFEHLPAGDYDLMARKDEGIAIYGANSTRETGENITLADGETRESVKLRFIHYASVSGHVSDPDGEPSAETQIWLFRAERGKLVEAGQSATDDRGEFHITRASPGRYYVFAAVSEFSMGGPGTGPPREDDATPPDRIVGQYYGGARDAKDATMVVVRDGEATTGIDIHLTSEPATRVVGRILGIPATTPAAAPGRGPVAPDQGWTTTDRFAQFTIKRISEPQFSMGLAAGPDGTFRTVWLGPGRYRVDASLMVDLKTYTASQTFDSHSGINDITLSLEPSQDLKGTLRVEGQAHPGLDAVILRPGYDAESGWVGTLSGKIGRGERVSAPVATDGHFTLTQVPSGEWELSPPPIEDAFFKSARLGDQDVRFKPFEVKAGSDATLDIVISTHSAKIHGEVDPGDADPAHAAILVAPVGEAHDFARDYHAVAADDHGKFELSGIAPGKYQIFAVERIAPSAIPDSDAAASFAALADFSREIDLTEDANLEIHPKLIPLERAREILP